MLSTAVVKRKRETLRTATGLKNVSQRRARFHSSDDRSFVYITISTVGFGARREKEDIHLPVAFDVDVWGYTLSLPLLCKGTATTSPGENAMGNKSDISRAPAISLIISLFAPPMTGYRIRDNELQFCTSRSAARDIRILSQGKFLVNFYNVGKEKPRKVVEWVSFDWENKLFVPRECRVAPCRRGLS